MLSPIVSNILVFSSNTFLVCYLIEKVKGSMRLFMLPHLTPALFLFAKGIAVPYSLDTSYNASS